jgi:MYXO-CTERM domain-containing protein
MPRLRSVLGLLIGLAGASPAAALPVTLTLVPSSASVGVGQTFSVDVVIDGLSELDGDFEEEIALESFDLSLAFDTSRLAFASLGFGSALGDPENAAQTFVSGPGDANGTGVALLFEFSLLSEAQLLALQAAPFTLATLEFEALAVPGDTVLQLVNLVGSSLGGIAGRALGDELAAPDALTIEVVPEPGAAALALAGLLVLRRRVVTG